MTAEPAQKIEPTGLRLNLGCGTNHLDGYVNVDRESSTNPDLRLDLENMPWPWDTGSADEILFNHVLEHLCYDPRQYRNLWKEVYRICAPNAEVRIVAPHPRHEHFLGDPTHCRPIHPLQFTLFDRVNCERWEREHAANSQLARYWGIDFELVSTELVPDPRWAMFRQPAEQTAEALQIDSETIGGVCSEMRMVLRCRK